MQSVEFIQFIEPAIKVLLLFLALGWWFFSSRSKASKLAKELEIAKQDILFLLQVEYEYGEEVRFLEGVSMKNMMRSKAKAQGYKWSGKFTKGSIDVSQQSESVEKQSLIEKLLK